MALNNYFTILAISFFLSSCTKNSSFKKDLLQSRTDDNKKGLIISCIRCNCVLTDLEKFSIKHKDVMMFGDTNCIAPVKSYILHHLPQPALDSIYKENYNLILFRWKGDKSLRWRLIQTKESLELEKLTDEFFKE